MLIYLSVSLTVMATGLGGILGCFMGHQKYLGKVLAITAGIMISIVSFELIPKAIDLTNIYSVILFIFIGIGLVEGLEILVDYLKPQQVNYYIDKTGLILLLVISIHNFPEGLAIGASGASDQKLGLILGVVVAIHDISEGMAIAVFLNRSNIGRTKVIIYTFASGLSTVLGAVLGYLMGNFSPVFASLSLGLAGGAMLYVVYLDILPEALKNDKIKVIANLVIIGLVVGLLIINFSL
jgi:ZIP family zinc transporter